KIIHSNTNSAKNQNILVTAPRGAGKTTLVRRVLAEARTSADFSRNWCPIFLGEESYAITTPGEFFLECLFHLQEQLQDRKWRSVYHEAEAQRDEELLLQSSLSALRRFAREQGKRILLIVENLHMILNEQIGEDTEKLRIMLGEASTIMVLATSVG